MIVDATETRIGGVTTPLGFRASGVSAGIKATGGFDLALLVSDTPAAAAAVFTTNRAQAAPVIVSREHLARGNGTRAAPSSSTAAARTPAPATRASRWRARWPPKPRGS